jgi:hypothetical protein
MGLDTWAQRLSWKYEYDERLTANQTIDSILGQGIVSRSRKVNDDGETAIEGILAAQIGATVNASALRGVDSGLYERGSAITDETFELQGSNNFVDNDTDSLWGRIGFCQGQNNRKGGDCDVHDSFHDCSNCCLFVGVIVFLCDGRFEK